MEERQGFLEVLEEKAAKVDGGGPERGKLDWRKVGRPLLGDENPFVAV